MMGKHAAAVSALGIFLVLLAFVSTPLAVAGAAEDYEAGRKAYQTGDVVSAIPKLRKAAEQGHVRAQTLLAYILDISEENEEAVKYYRMAADQGDPEGMFGLGAMYAAGEGVGKDYQQALLWFRRAAEKDYTPAINVLANAYWKGGLGLEEGGKKDNEQALYWIRRAAEKGDLPSIQALAEAYRNGLLGLTADAEQAKIWEARATALGAKSGKDSKAGKKK